MQNPAGPAIVLASSSRHRRALLGRLLDDFVSLAPDVDETRQPRETPEALAPRLARAKAEAVARAHTDAVVIGADQVAVLDGCVVGKAGSAEAAVEQLMAAAGREMRFLTAVCVLAPGHPAAEHTDVTRVHFRRFGRRLAESYVAHDRPWDCAGSFRVEGAGVVLFESVRTEDPTALVGLPMIWLAGRLAALGCLQS